MIKIVSFNSLLLTALLVLIFLLLASQVYALDNTQVRQVYVDRVAPCGGVGDVNNDSLISGKDHRIIENIVRNRYVHPLSASIDLTEVLNRSDVNNDGIINLKDLRDITLYFKYYDLETFKACLPPILPDSDLENPNLN